MISHDLRSPLSTLIGISDLLMNDKEFVNKITDEEKEYIEHINLELHRAVDYLEKLYGWTRLSTVRFELKVKKSMLKTLIENSHTIYKSRLSQKNIRCSVHIKNTLYIEADETLFIQLINNLIGNAIKFTHSGGKIDITAEEYNDKVMLKIEDNGGGIAEHKIQTILTENQSVTTYGTQGEQGTGSGIKIRRIITDAQALILPLSPLSTRVPWRSLQYL